MQIPKKEVEQLQNHRLEILKIALQKTLQTWVQIIQNKNNMAKTKKPQKLSEGRKITKPKNVSSGKKKKSK
jgi:hypothetical protein